MGRWPAFLDPNSQPFLNTLLEAGLNTQYCTERLGLLAPLPPEYSVVFENRYLLQYYT